MVDKKEDKLLKVFSNAFHEVVAPLIEPMAEDINSLKGGQERIERQLEKIQDRMDRHSKVWEGHTKKIKRLERIHPQARHLRI